MPSRTPTTKNKRALPPPTASERAFESALARVRAGREPVAVGADAPIRSGDAGAFVERAFARSAEFLRDRYASIGEASQFHTKLAGVSFEGRQDVIAGLRVGVDVQLQRQPENQFDSNAIAVLFGALQLGFINKGIAKHIAPLIDDGARYQARIESLTGGAPSTSSGQAHQRKRGVNVYVWRDAAASIAQRAVQSAELRARVRTTGDDLEDAVRRALIGDGHPHKAQLDVLERVEGGSNTLAVLGTGRGKSFCFQYPATLRALRGGGKTLVIYPLRALANDQYEALLRKLDPFGLRIYRANGSISHDEREELFEALQEGEWDIILATPEFLEFHRQEFTGSSAPRFVVVDEAHHLYESKHRAAYGRLGETIASLGNPQVLALTATANDDAFAQIVRDLKIGAWVIDPTVRENLHVTDARGTRDKAEYLHDLFRNGDKGIIYCNSRTEATKVAEALRKKLGNRVMFYHAGMPTPERHDVERFFRNGELQAVVATSAFGEGIDLPDVRHVVLYHLNFDFTEFNQQAGRAGRDGGEAKIHLLFGEQDRAINEFIIDREAPTLNVLRAVYRGVRGIAHEGEVRMSYVDIARTLELDKVNERTVSRALHIFEDEGLVEIAEDDAGRYIRFRKVDGKVDLTQNERFAEGEAERESFKRFCELVLNAKSDALERIINRPIYPSKVELLR
ncbi:MAG: DEAD/DEAH box helicase [Candidatus Eremiobacteraeota bacterium]|nr:DEAD/DEAH box helicase [Candidatus Eremiobacteraeota bacterium]